MKIVIFTEEYVYVSNGLWNASFNLHSELNRMGHESLIMVNKQHWINDSILRELRSGTPTIIIGPLQINFKDLGLLPFKSLNSLLYYVSKIINSFLLLLHLSRDMYRLYLLKPDMFIIQSGGLPNGLMVKYILFVSFFIRVKLF